MLNLWLCQIANMITTKDWTLKDLNPKSTHEMNSSIVSKKEAHCLEKKTKGGVPENDSTCTDIISGFNAVPYRFSSAAMADFAGLLGLKLSVTYCSQLHHLFCYIEMYVWLTSPFLPYKDVCLTQKNDTTIYQTIYILCCLTSHSLSYKFLCSVLS